MKGFFMSGYFVRTLSENGKLTHEVIDPRDKKPIARTITEADALLIVRALNHLEQGQLSARGEQ
jgi:hypothetical protein